MKRFASLLAIVALPSVAVACTGAPDEQSSKRESEVVVDERGEPCGAVTCGAGKVCCNASCGICTGPDEACIMLVCDPDATPAPPPPTTPGRCIKTGCSGQLCSDQDVGSTCEWLPEYACYQTAICERQSDGNCAFRKTKELADCLTENAQSSE